METRVSEIADIVKGRLMGSFDLKRRMTGTCPIDGYVPNKVSFVRNQKYAGFLNGLKDAVVLIPESLVEFCENHPQNAYIVVDNVINAMMDVQLFFYRKLSDAGVSLTVVVGKSAKIGKGVFIGEHVFIGENVVVGDRTRIMHNVCIYDNCRIGNDCQIYAGAVIGSDGFRFEQDIENKMVRKMIHVGGVVIGDRVEIGANSAIDRATFENEATVISDDVKIDNLVHIAHNVKIGDRALIVALSCIGGSVKIGDDAWIGIGVSITAGVTIGNRAKALMGAVVAHDVKDDEVVSGYYAMPHREWKRIWQGWMEK